MWCHVTIVAKFMDLTNSSWQRRPFSLWNDGRREWELPFVPERNNAQESHRSTSIVFIFFCHTCKTMVCWDTATWRNDFSCPLNGKSMPYVIASLTKTLLIFERQYILYLVISSDLCFEIWDVILNVATSTTTRILCRFQKLSFESYHINEKQNFTYL